MKLLITVLVLSIGLSAQTTERRVKSQDRDCPAVGEKPVERYLVELPPLPVKKQVKHKRHHLRRRHK